MKYFTSKKVDFPSMQAVINDGQVRDKLNKIISKL